MSILIVWLCLGVGCMCYMQGKSAYIGKSPTAIKVCQNAGVLLYSNVGGELWGWSVEDSFYGPWSTRYTRSPIVSIECSMYDFSQELDKHYLLTLHADNTVVVWEQYFWWWSYSISAVWKVSVETKVLGISVSPNSYAMYGENMKIYWYREASSVETIQLDALPLQIKLDFKDNLYVLYEKQLNMYSAPTIMNRFILPQQQQAYSFDLNQVEDSYANVAISTVKGNIIIIDQNQYLYQVIGLNLTTSCRYCDGGLMFIKNSENGLSVYSENGQQWDYLQGSYWIHQSNISYVCVANVGISNIFMIEKDGFSDYYVEVYTEYSWYLWVYMIMFGCCCCCCYGCCKGLGGANFNCAGCRGFFSAAAEFIYIGLCVCPDADLVEEVEDSINS